MGRKSIVSALALGVCATVLLPTTAQAVQDRVSGTEKGSVFMFSKVEVIWSSDSETLIQDTFLQLTNDNNQPVDVQMYFINGDAPLESFEDGSGGYDQPGWNWIDNRISLTANQPTYWSAFTGQPAAGGLSPWEVLDPEGNFGDPFVGRPNGDGDRWIRGYIIGWAVDADNVEIAFDHLAGTATLVNYDDEYAWEYNAWSFQSVDTVVGDGILNLDGSEYAPGFALLLLNFQAVDSDAWSSDSAGDTVESDTFLTLHPISADLRQETEGPVLTKAHMDVWNMNEVKFSGAYRCVECWNQDSLRETNANHFLVDFLQTDHGKARIDGLASQLCDTPTNTSVAASILGVSHKELAFDGGSLGYGAAGSNLFGMGTEGGVVQYDPGTSPIPTAPQNVNTKATSFTNGVVRMLGR